MDITLRKAARVVARIDGKIQELATKLYETPTTTVFVRDDNSDITRRLAQAQTDCTDLLQGITELSDARKVLRTLVGKANEENGVNALVTAKKSLEMCLLVVRSLRGRINEPVLSKRELENRLTALRERASTPTAQVALRGIHDDTKAQFDTLSQNTIDKLAISEEKYMSEIETIQDQLERINNITTFQIPANVVTTLQEFIVL